VETFSLPYKPAAIAATVALVFVGAFYGFYQAALSNPNLGSEPAQIQTQIQTQIQANAQTESLPPVQAIEKQISVESERVQPVVNTLSSEQRILKQAISQSLNIDKAYAGLFGLWQRQPITGLTPCQAAMDQGLACHQQQGNWHSISRLNYPAVVYLQDESLGDFYGVLVEREDDQVLLQLNEQQLWVSKHWFNQHFSGTFELLWQPTKRVPREISRGSHLSQVQWLENNLAKINGRQARLMDNFDLELERELMAFQRHHGLKADGIAGSQTLVQLNLFTSKQGPRLTSALSNTREAL
jgi:general secretion pathway protein A